MAIKEHDQRRGYCRMLGHEVSFAYCRQAGQSLPCRNVGNCWFEFFDVEVFIREHYTADQIEAMLAPAKPKMTTLIELIEQARKNAGEKKLEG